MIGFMSFFMDNGTYFLINTIAWLQNYELIWKKDFGGIFYMYKQTY